MSKIQHILFDFDGVLCDSLAAAMDAFNAIRNKHFPEARIPEVSSPQDMTVVYSGSLRTCFHRWLSEQNAKRFFDLHSAQMKAVADTLKPFPGVGRLLGRLAPQRCSIVTSAYSPAVRTVLAKDPAYTENAIYQIAGRELRRKKSDKINAILGSLNLTPDEALYVGDLESDILYCRDVPIDIIAVGYGYHPASYLSSKTPTHLVNSVDELEHLLDNSFQILNPKEVQAL